MTWLSSSSNLKAAIRELCRQIRYRFIMPDRAHLSAAAAEQQKGLMRRASRAKPACFTFLFTARLARVAHFSQQHMPNSNLDIGR